MDNCCTVNMRDLLVGKDWIKVQEILSRQENRRYRLPRTTKSILSGILKCSNCGSCLRPKQSVNDNGKRFYYVCELKERSNGHRCKIKNLNGNDIDKIVLKKVKELTAPNSEIYKSLKSIADIVDYEEEERKAKIGRLNSLYRKNKRDKENYIEKLNLISDDDIFQDIIRKIKELKNANIELEKEMKELDISKNEICDKETAKYMLDIIDNHFNNFEKLDILEQRDLIKLLIKDVITDGENLTINLLGSSTNNLLPIGEDCK